MKKPLIILGIIIVIVLLYSWSSYNTFVTMKESATAGWQQVETQYQRRFDLIPNLVESVKGAMNQEQAIFTALAEARTRYAGAQNINERALAASQVETSLGRLLAVIENYPTLKSIDAVQNLMTQLEGTENRVSVERQRFNESVRTYNVAVKRFPKSVIASIFDFDELAYFEAQTGADVAPKVQF